MTMVHEQIREAAKSLEKRRKYETGWYEQRIKELEAEHNILRKDNAYLIDQLPIQKHQKYLEGLEAAAQEAEKHINEYADPSYNGACTFITECIRALKEPVKMTDYDVALKRILELEAERDSLRDALQEISDLEKELRESGDVSMYAIDIARQTLND